MEENPIRSQCCRAFDSATVHVAADTHKPINENVNIHEHCGAVLARVSKACQERLIAPVADLSGACTLQTG